VIITAGAPGEQLCWSEPWMPFSARTGCWGRDGCRQGLERHDRLHCLLKATLCSSTGRYAVSEAKGTPVTVQKRAARQTRCAPRKLAAPPPAFWPETDAPASPGALPTRAPRGHADRSRKAPGGFEGGGEADPPGVGAGLGLDDVGHRHARQLLGSAWVPCCLGNPLPPRLKNPVSGAGR
jgi:hypothetical protein